MDEAQFWLEIIQDLKLIKPDKLSLLLQEASELTKILGASRQTAFKQLTINN